nr:SIFamide [Urechis unicinctus]QUP52029.1 FFamide [Urechis unicinctus]
MDSRVMMMSLVTLSLVACLLVNQVTAEPLEDQLPETSGLFFGKRSSHPNMNNLLFGRRSYAQLAAKLQMEEAREFCQTVKEQCARVGLEN